MKGYRIQKLSRSNLGSSLIMGEEGWEEGRLLNELAQVHVYIMFIELRK